MFKWNVKEMLLMKEKNNSILGRLNTMVYSYEYSVSREDKIAFVDSMQDGKLSYLLSLIKKFHEDQVDMPKDEFGHVKTVSLKAWIKRNDTRYNYPIIDNRCDYGEYAILDCTRYIQHDYKGVYDYHDDLVDECFHRQLKKCEQEEERYFLNHDEYSILSKQLDKKINQYNTTFGLELWVSTDGIEISNPSTNETRKITIEELKDLLSKYAQLDELVDKITAETHIV